MNNSSTFPKDQSTIQFAGQICYAVSLFCLLFSILSYIFYKHHSKIYKRDQKSWYLGNSENRESIINNSLKKVKLDSTNPQTTKTSLLTDNRQDVSCTTHQTTQIVLPTSESVDRRYKSFLEEHDFGSDTVSLGSNVSNHSGNLRNIKKKAPPVPVKNDNKNNQSAKVPIKPVKPIKAPKRTTSIKIGIPVSEQLKSIQQRKAMFESPTKEEDEKTSNNPVQRSTSRASEPSIARRREHIKKVKASEFVTTDEELPVTPEKSGNSSGNRLIVERKTSRASMKSIARRKQEIVKSREFSSSDEE